MKDKIAMNKAPEQLLEELKVKFDANFSACLKCDCVDLSKVFLYARAISEVGQILKAYQFSKHHEKCCIIFDEIFSDIISSLYLASAAIDKPATIVLRRVVELGIAVVYLWDLPHIAYSWELFKHDLNFTEMLNHIKSDGFKAYVCAENVREPESEAIPTGNLKEYYSEFSDIAHGRITSFESTLNDRFTFSLTDWREFVRKAEQISKTLLDLYIWRFNIKSELLSKLPTLDRG